MLSGYPPAFYGMFAMLSHLRCSKEIEVSRLEACGACTGSGIKAGTSASTCSTCGGSGQVVQAVRTPLGVFQQVNTRSSRSRLACTPVLLLIISCKQQQHLISHADWCRACISAGHCFESDLNARYLEARSGMRAACTICMSSWFCWS